MKKLILIIILIFVSAGEAGEITFECTGKADINGYTFNDNSSYKLYRSNGHWKSSTGDFGLHACLELLLLIKMERMGLMFTAEIYLKTMTIL